MGNLTSWESEAQGSADHGRAGAGCRRARRVLVAIAQKSASGRRGRCYAVESPRILIICSIYWVPFDFANILFG